jgi:hypothetical protein
MPKKKPVKKYRYGGRVGQAGPLTKVDRASRGRSASAKTAYNTRATKGQTIAQRKRRDASARTNRARGGRSSRGYSR